MTDEEYFRKNYPDYCYGDRLLSPYWDLFQDGVEFSERQSEKEIADLKETNAILSESASITHKDIEYKVSVIEQRNKRIDELKKENAELKEKADKCLHLADVRLEQELETYQRLHITSREKLDTEIALDEVNGQLTKAKELLTKWVELFKPKGGNIPPTPIQVDTEQFIKEIEK